MGDKLTVICDAVSWDYLNETLFITDVLLSRLGRPVSYLVFDPDESIAIPNDVLALNHEGRLSKLVGLMIAKGVQNLGLVSWSHNYNEDTSFYPFVDYILRPFYNAERQTPLTGSRCREIAWFPIGYKSGVGPRRFDLLPSFAERRHEMFFAGHLGTNQDERGEMAAVLNRFDMPVRLSLTEAFGKGVGVSRYRNLMENSRFALCPGGKDAESIRLFEALELGAIPVSLKHDFLTRPDAMDRAPIILLDSWEQWPQWYYGALSKPGYLEEMEALRQAIAAWWTVFKVEQADKVAKVINAGFAGR